MELLSPGLRGCLHSGMEEREGVGESWILLLLLVIDHRHITALPLSLSFLLCKMGIETATVEGSGEGKMRGSREN